MKTVVALNLLLCLAASVDASSLRKYDNSERSLKGDVLPWPEENDFVFDDHGIVNGNDAFPDQFPWYVKFEGGTLCGGSLVYKDIVLTAAHCVDGGPPPSVRVGATTNTDGTVVAVCDAIIHPQYNSKKLFNDVALLVLCSPQANTRTVGLNSNKLYPNAPGQLLTTLGFGRTSTNSGSANRLLYVEMGFLTDVECENRFKQHDWDQNICVDTDGGICFGDSGGPLVDGTGKQVGVASFIIDSCASSYPDFFADVSLFYDWIQGQICELSNSKPGTCPVTGGVLLDFLNLLGQVATGFIALFVSLIFGPQ